MPLLQKYENAAAVTIQLLKQIGNATGPEKVIAELDKHPDYPSLLAVSDVLSHFKIENAAYRISDEDLEDVPYPFLAQTNINSDDFICCQQNKRWVGLHIQREPEKSPGKSGRIQKSFQWHCIKRSKSLLSRNHNLKTKSTGLHIKHQ